MTSQLMANSLMKNASDSNLVSETKLESGAFFKATGRLKPAYSQPVNDLSVVFILDTVPQP